MFAVPTVDLAPYVDPQGSVEARARTAAALDEACRTVGFVQVTGHGVPDDVAAGLASALDDVFALPVAEKKALVVTEPSSPSLRSPLEGTNRGYSPPRSESVSRSLGVEQATRMNDFFEAFNVGTTADGPQTGGDGNRWPDIAGFRDRVEAWFAEAQRVARTLTTAFADALDVAPDTFTRLAHDPVEVLRMNNYALDEQDLPDGADLTGMGEHTDYGIVTVLWADRVAGLQVLGPDDGVWHDVLPAEGALLVNLGDLTARLTGDRWRSTLHRVKPPIEQRPGGGLRIRRRRSAAFFHDGDLDAVVETLPLAGAQPYPPTTIRDHLAAKLGGSRGGTPNAAADREAARVHAATSQISSVDAR
ncbi:MAG TPA: 2-oxoglutarate and iron-dependent oxygenase domain-containing protein [Actinomycetospora sp.]|jgi:isopenicillin N synthase-like dioxygenase|uniref:isopenicillin N synthase family dioxygenase n=1 Tax=Actinomycetospora sp. TaxID=1872135 RepID=UPI002F4283E3